MPKTRAEILQGLAIGIGSWVVVILVWAAYTYAPPLIAQGPAGEPFRCVVTTSTATTITAVGGSCAAVTGQVLYITDILFSASATGIAADAFPTLKYGTGTTCGTGTTIFWGALSAAAFVTPVSLRTPIKLPAGVDVCWISSTAGSKFLVLSGYLGT